MRRHVKRGKTQESETEKSLNNMHQYTQSVAEISTIRKYVQKLFSF